MRSGFGFGFTFNIIKSKNIGWNYVGNGKTDGAEVKIDISMCVYVCGNCHHLYFIFIHHFIIHTAIYIYLTKSF